MKRIRVTVDSTALPMPMLCHRLLDRERIETVEIVNWNVSEPPAGFLYRIRGEYDQLAAQLDASPHFSAYEILPETDRKCYCFAAGELPPKAQVLFETVTTGSLLVVPPITVNPDQTYTTTLVGTESDIQAAVGNVPDALEVSIDAVGGSQVASDGVLGALSPRQREALETALALGYYEVPRNVVMDDIAAALDCTTATAAEHLQKAESTVISLLFGGDHQTDRQQSVAGEEV